MVHNCTLCEMMRNDLFTLVRCAIISRLWTVLDQDQRSMTCLILAPPLYASIIMIISIRKLELEAESVVRWSKVIFLGQKGINGIWIGWMVTAKGPNNWYDFESVGQTLWSQGFFMLCPCVLIICWKGRLKIHHAQCYFWLWFSFEII